MGTMVQNRSRSIIFAFLFIFRLAYRILEAIPGMPLNSCGRSAPGGTHNSASGV